VKGRGRARRGMQDACFQGYCLVERGGNRQEAPTVGSDGRVE
jgi:hypothetical protein